MKSDTISIRATTKKCFPGQDDKSNSFNALYKGAQKFINDVFNVMGVDLKKHKKCFKKRNYKYKINKKAEDIIVSSCIRSSGFPSFRDIWEDIGKYNDRAKAYMQLINEFLKENFTSEEIEIINQDLREKKGSIEVFCNNCLNGFGDLGIKFMQNGGGFLDIEKLIFDLEHLNEYEEQYVEYGHLSKKSSTIISALILIKQADDYNKYVYSTIKSAESINNLQNFLDY